MKLLHSSILPFYYVIRDSNDNIVRLSSGKYSFYSEQGARLGLYWNLRTMCYNWKWDGKYPPYSELRAQEYLNRGYGIKNKDMKYQFNINGELMTFDSLWQVIDKLLELGIYKICRIPN